MHKSRTKSFLPAFMLMLMISSTSSATVIFGGYDCGQWVKRPKNHPMESWISGYLSGLNSMYSISSSSPTDPLDQLNSLDQVYLWLDNFCKANPLRKVDGGALELFIELKVKAQH